MAIAQQRPIDSVARNLKVIDADTHLSEPEDLWTKRAPAKFKDRVPQIGNVDGKVSWVINGNHAIGLGGSASSIFHKDGRVSEGMSTNTARVYNIPV